MSDSYRVYGRSLQELGSDAVLNQNVHAIADPLNLRRTAPPLEQYNGPVLFEEEAAGELFARAFAEQLPGQPRVISDNPQLPQGLRMQQGTSAFLTKLGARVMPDFVSVIDDPTASMEKGQTLRGGYKLDEEGTPARPTLVVENGILKTLLTSRAPVAGALHSTGNLRGSGVGPSNLFLNASKASSREDLLAQFKNMVKSRGLDYGIVVRKLSNRALVLAYRVYPDGREEPIRKAFLMDFSSAMFKEIAAISNERTVYTEPLALRNSSLLEYGPVRTGPTLVSYVVPALLFEDITVHGPSEEVSKPPVLPHPYFANRQSSGR